MSPTPEMKDFSELNPDPILLETIHFDPQSMTSESHFPHKASHSEPQIKAPLEPESLAEPLIVFPIVPKMRGPRRFTPSHTESLTDSNGATSSAATSSDLDGFNQDHLSHLDVESIEITPIAQRSSEALSSDANDTNTLEDPWSSHWAATPSIGPLSNHQATVGSQVSTSGHPRSDDRSGQVGEINSPSLNSDLTHQPVLSAHSSREMIKPILAVRRIHSPRQKSPSPMDVASQSSPKMPLMPTQPASVSTQRETFSPTNNPNASLASASRLSQGDIFAQPLDAQSSLIREPVALTRAQASIREVQMEFQEPVPRRTGIIEQAVSDDFAHLDLDSSENHALHVSLKPLLQTSIPPAGVRTVPTEAHRTLTKPSLGDPMNHQPLTRPAPRMQPTESSAPVTAAPTIRRAPSSIRHPSSSADGKSTRAKTPMPLSEQLAQSATMGLGRQHAGGPLAAARNSLIGMALVYAERIEVLFSPVIFLGKNLGSVLAALLHMFLPLIVAFGISHWNETISASFWSGNLVAQAINFIGTWVLCLLAWSFIWVCLTGVFHIAGQSLQHYEDEGRKHFDQD